MPIPLGILAVAGAGAAGGGGAFDLLETTVLSTATGEITFTNLGAYSAYKHLQIRLTVRGVNGSTFPELRMKINNDSTAANYAAHALRGYGSGVDSSATTGVAWMRIGNAPKTTTTSAFGVSVIDILDFSSTNKNKTVRTLSGYTADGYDDIRLQSGLWASTSAVTEIDIFSSSFDLAAGSRFSLYGIK